jgi:hypothetical protein
MYYQYPIETLVRGRRVASQIDFARRAREALQDTDELLSRPFPAGLALFAANEDALEEPARILRDLYGESVELRAPRARIIPGNPAQQPIMNVRVTARAEHSVAIVAGLRRRGARIVEECIRGRTFIVRAEAPLALLIGFPAALAACTDGTANHAIRLLRYAPVSDDLEPGAA